MYIILSSSMVLAQVTTISSLPACRESERERESLLCYIQMCTLLDQTVIRSISFPSKHASSIIRLSSDPSASQLQIAPLNGPRLHNAQEKSDLHLLVDLLPARMYIHVSLLSLFLPLCTTPLNDHSSCTKALSTLTLLKIQDVL
jgi:hypothetical protein